MDRFLKLIGLRPEDGYGRPFEGTSIWALVVLVVVGVATARGVDALIDLL